MIDLVKKFFGKGPEGDSDEKQGDNPHDIRIATCAIFLEMAHIDGEFSKSEQKHILSTLKKDYDLSDEHAASLLESSGKELDGSIDLWQFTNRINQNYSTEEKLQIIETVWEIAYKDGRLDKHEDYLVHKVAKLLRLSHKQLIDAKLKVIHR